jgi:hypothetical protein
MYLSNSGEEHLIIERRQARVGDIPVLQNMASVQQFMIQAVSEQRIACSLKESPDQSSQSFHPNMMDTKTTREYRPDHHHLLRFNDHVCI